MVSTWVLKDSLIRVNMNTQVFGRVGNLQDMAMDSLWGRDGIPLVGNLDNLALGGTEVHEPLGFPVLEGGLNPSDDSQHHRWKWVVCTQHYRSLVNNLTVVEFVMQSGRSFISIRKSRGPRTLPCGTPDDTMDSLLFWPSTSTDCVREWRKSEEIWNPFQSHAFDTAVLDFFFFFPY